MTDEIIVLVKPPAQVCQDCVDNARHQSEDVGIVWCEHHMSGGMYMVATGMWQISGPFATESDFKRYVVRAFTQHLPRN